MVSKILDKRKDNQRRTVPLKVVHSHGHGDHKANDFQFLNQPNVELVGPTLESNIQFFKINDWPNRSVIYDLGNRELTIIPIPGHDLTSIAIYDSQTQWLLTGDTVYPGRLYVRDWEAFKKSIQRLSNFCNAQKVSFLMGNHIEMADRPGVDYPTGTTFHPHEHILPMQPGVLDEIKSTFKGKKTAPKRDVHPDFIIEAVN
jgi:flavorubredoxin